ncbi:MAG TPA: hypothetical protein VFN36_05470 [Solirubrobacteraceae bacterium]|nr:hypothetical protein [Solirubrobacteraceae bacterium]
MPSKGLPSPYMTFAVARGLQRVPGLRRLPLTRLLVLAEVGMLAKTHFDRLTPPERRRLMVLVKEARGWPQNLDDAQRGELQRLIGKVEPRAFADAAIERFSPLGARR